MAGALHKYIDRLAGAVARNRLTARVARFVTDHVYADTEGDYRVLLGAGRGLRLRINARTQTALIYGTYEREIIARLVTHAAPGTVFWDIGANIGYFSCIIARLAGTRVIAVEPNPENVVRLERSASLNDLDITVVESALGDTERAGILTGHASPSMGRLATVGEDGVEDGLDVNVATIDSLVGRGLPPPTLMKIDVEGAEAEVLAGGFSTIASFKPAILVEIHHPRAWKECRRLLEKNGYEIYTLDGTALVEASRELDAGHIWCIPRDEAAVSRT